MNVNHDLLADYVGGALEGTPEQEHVAGLIATSREWGRAADELTAALRGVQNDLNVLREDPERMPDDVAARFEGLFDGPRRDPLEPRVATRHSRRAGWTRLKGWKRWAAPVAIAAAALGLFAIGKVPSLTAPAMSDGSRNNSQLSADAPGVAPPAPVPTMATWRTYDRNSLQKALASGGSPLTYGTDGALRSGTAEKAPEAAVPSFRLLDPFALQQCTNAVAAVVPGRVTFVEYAYFEGSPAIVMYVTSPNGQVLFVAGTNCGQLGPDERYRTPPK